MALCQVSISPYIVHPSTSYKPEIIHAQTELSGIRKLKFDTKYGENDKIPLPELWKKRIKRARKDLFYDTVKYVWIQCSKHLAFNTIIP